MAALLAVAASLAASAAHAEPHQMRCDIYRAYGCAATGCSEVTTKAWSTIDWDAKDYALCDASGCQHHKFSDWADGVYRSLSFVGADLMVKVNLTDMSLVETGTALNFSITSFGNCSRQPAPAP